MGEANRIAVIDIGKTNAKVVLFDLAAAREIAFEKIENRPRTGPPHRHFDVERLYNFIIAALDKLYRAHGIDEISITTHGACFVCLNGFGELALPVMDYEDTAPDTLDADYRAIRPAFSETGSPRLPMGLNAGAMLHWQMRTFPDAFAKTRWILPWAQYWAFRLTGEIATEATSLGVHTDLWSPVSRDFSSMVDRLGWRPLMPRLMRADHLAGTLTATATDGWSLPAGIPVRSGIHDSNASLLPHLLSRSAPFSVLSTGTWVISMAVGGTVPKLDEARDTLFNVNALGDPVPSARFMGGRAFEMLTADHPGTISQADRTRVLKDKVMVLPSFPEGSGPFARAKGRWIGDARTAGETRYAASLHLALMAGIDLDLIGAEGDVIVEGPFAGNEDFLDMLSVLTGRDPVIAEGRMSGTAFGAACLCLDGRPLSAARGDRGPKRRPDPALATYADAWRTAVAEL